MRTHEPATTVGPRPAPTAELRIGAEKRALVRPFAVLAVPSAVAWVLAFAAGASSEGRETGMVLGAVWLVIPVVACAVWWRRWGRVTVTIGPDQVEIVDRHGAAGQTISARQVTGVAVVGSGEGPLFWLVAYVLTLSSPWPSIAVSGRQDGVGFCYVTPPVLTVSRVERHGRRMVERVPHLIDPGLDPSPEGPADPGPSSRDVTLRVSPRWWNRGPRTIRIEARPDRVRLHAADGAILASVRPGRIDHWSLERRGLWERSVPLQSPRLVLAGQDPQDRTVVNLPHLAEAEQRELVDTLRRAFPASAWTVVDRLDLDDLGGDDAGTSLVSWGSVSAPLD